MVQRTRYSPAANPLRRQGGQHAEAIACKLRRLPGGITRRRHRGGEPQREGDEGRYDEQMAPRGALGAQRRAQPRARKREGGHERGHEVAAGHDGGEGGERHRAHGRTARGVGAPARTAAQHAHGKPHHHQKQRMVERIVDGRVIPPDALYRARHELRLEQQHPRRDAHPHRAPRPEHIPHQHARRVGRRGDECRHDADGARAIELLGEHARLQRHEKDSGIGALPGKEGVDDLGDRGGERRGGATARREREVHVDAVVPVVRVAVVVRGDGDHRHERRSQERDERDGEHPLGAHAFEPPHRGEGARGKRTQDGGEQTVGHVPPLPGGPAERAGRIGG